MDESFSDRNKATSFQDYTVLIVDDNPTNLGVLSNHLKEYGFQIVVARSGESALKRVRHVRPDIILLDILMPGINGFETCRRLKEDEATHDIPIIFMTALSEVDDKVQGFEVGAVDYVTKPFQHEEVLARLQMHLRLRDLTESLRQANQSLAKRTVQLEATYQIGQYITSILDLDKLLDEVVSLIQTLFDYYFVGIWLADETQSQLVLQANASSNDHRQRMADQKIRLDLDTIDNHIVTQVYQTKEYYLANDIDSDAIYLAVQGLLETRSELALPLRVGSEMIGALDICSNRPDTFHTEDRRVLQNLADQIAIAIRNAQLYTTQKRLRELEEKRAKELAELNRAKDKFFSIVAHDLKGPFLPLLGFASLLPEMVDTDPPEAIKASARSIHKSAKNVYTLLENLLEWSRLQMDRSEYEPIRLHLRNAIEYNIGLLKPNAAAKNIRLKNQAPAGLFVQADKNMLDTILRNLLTNAIKFTPQGGEVTISAGPGDLVLRRKDNQLNTMTEFIKVIVSDTGLGISEEEQARLFQLDKPHTTRGTEEEKGTGLGLIICKEMIEKHGGQLRLESQVGQGTTVKFTLKAAESEVERQ